MFSAKKFLFSTKGFVLPMVFFLIFIMGTFGAWFLFSTLHSKNTFDVYFRDETARILSESALAEWRATLVSKRFKGGEIKNLLLNPKSSPVAITASDLPRTVEIANRLAGSGRWSLSGLVSIRNVDNELLETVGVVKKKGAFGNEYQGTMRLTFHIGLGSSSQSGSALSHFTYEFDLKVACLRSEPSGRTNRGYTSSALNDYVLYIRDGKQELEPAAVWTSVANGTLTIGHSDSNAKGKIFLGGAKADEIEKTGKFIFMETGEHLDSIPPTPRLIGRTGPAEFSQFLPFSTSLLRSFNFLNSKELFDGPFCDGKVLKLNGIYFIKDSENGLVIPNGLKYEGKGVLISFGNIRIEGNFSKNSPEDGPCILFTWKGNIFANTVIPGKIEASLVALRYDFNPMSSTSPRGTVNFSQRKANVLGNLLVDRLNLESMSSSQNNTIIYDSSSLRGDDLYSITVGGQLRRLGVVLNEKDSHP